MLNHETWIPTIRAWPICSAPLTLGGGRICTQQENET